MSIAKAGWHRKLRSAVVLRGRYFPGARRSQITVPRSLSALYGFVVNLRKFACPYCPSLMTES
ncbi:hypothetical protein R8510_05341 [Ralstonia chuxiongensis]|nr:hypothetical protein R8510_05341 [Ralstonia chuxiongensis]